jgi:hypothetical protein
MNVKIYQMAVKCSKSPLNKPEFSVPKPSKTYPNWDLWFENIPSGNPAYWTIVFFGHFL